MITISVLNQKGGVGKTSTAVNIAAELAKRGKRVLVIDLDSQGNASMYLDHEISNLRLKTTIYHLLINENKVENVLVKTAIKNLDLIPSNSNLGAAELSIANLPNKETLLLNIIAGIKSQYDFIIIDCPPALGALSINALIASSHIVIPMQCEEFALKGLLNLINTIQIMGRHKFNNSLSILGILLTMYESKSKLTKEIEANIRSSLGNFLFSTKIPRNIKIAEASRLKKPAVTAFPNSTGSVAYSALVDEMLQRLKIL